MAINVILSVHQLVDFLLRSGSIDTRIYNSDTMQEGTRIHMRYQAIQAGNYQSEVPLQCDFEYEEFVFTLQGRADGIIKEDQRYIIDEIKSAKDDLENFHAVQGRWHLGQAICYGYMFAKEQSLTEIGVRLTYISQIDSSRLIKDFIFTFKQLEDKVRELIADYSVYYRSLIEHKRLLKKTAKELEFPYEDFRKGQREVAKYVYKVASDGGLFFFEAPTGTGKTMSTIYPVIKTFAEEKNDKIFYLSAKTQAKDVAFQAMKMLTNKGLQSRSIILTAKEHMCIAENKNCNPDECPYTINYYDKINNIIKEILLNEKNINSDTIFKYALINNVCPFECQLDVSNYCDVIICDYNYLFDPVVYLKRFFEESSENYFALIDEAHNLSERTKDMYTLAIEEEILLDLRKSFRKFKTIALKRDIKKLISYFDTVKQDEEYQIVENDFSKEFYNYLENIYSSMQDVMKNHPEYVNDEFTDASKMINRFLKIHGYLNDAFITYFEVKNDFVKAYIRCLDSASLIHNTIQNIRGAVFFSATLSPIEYYIKTLGGDEQTPYLKLPSPFEQDHLCLLVRSDISTRYKDRDMSYKAIAESIKAVCESKVGNYLVFFSSYQYLINVLSVFKQEDFNVIVQSKEMTHKDRDLFLNSFTLNPTSTTIGFAVLGGAFSEGIDLVSSRLIGAIIVGVGLPMVSFERNLIKNYYDNKGLNGFDYSYTNPGKNKVMQAAGRVIRSAEDKGVVLLIDQRFMQSNYRDLFRFEWSHYIRVNSIEQIKNHLSLFWKKDEK